MGKAGFIYRKVEYIFIAFTVQSRRLKRAEHVARMGERANFTFTLTFSSKV
jgi:hypothetical protein